MLHHIHASALSGMITAAFIIIFGFLWRSLSMRWSERPIGQAMAFIY